MDNIIEPTMDYDFSKLYLGPPSNLTGGAYFTRIMYGNNKQLFIQTPKSLSKQGFVKSGKKIYIDLMFDNNDTVFINWIENLEQKCQELIYSKGKSWFETQLEKDDIETAFTSPFKIFKSGKYYLLRVNVKPSIKIYSETDEIMKMEDISTDKPLISILEIQGIKFTPRNFQIEIELKQSMVVSPDPFLDECFIKKPLKKENAHIASLTPTKTMGLSTTGLSTTATSTNVMTSEPFNTTSSFIESSTITNNNNSTIDLEEFIVDSVEAIKEQNKSSQEDELEEVQIDLGIEDIEDPTTKANTIANSGQPYVEPTSSLLTIDNSNDENDEQNIVLDIEDLDVPTNIETDKDILKEVDVLNVGVETGNLETITLKKPNQVYYEIYKKARDKAKELKKEALTAYLEMKNIKKTYMLDDIDSSDEEFESFGDEE